MPRQRNYSEAEVRDILRGSEDRVTTFRTGQRGAAGHAFGSHVDQSTSAMEARSKGRRVDNDGMAGLVCTFVSSPEQVRAATLTLNSPEGQEALGDLDARGPGARVRIDIAIAPPVSIKYAADGHCRTLRATDVPNGTGTAVRMIIDAGPGDDRIHIHTFFPQLFLDANQPAWQRIV